MNNEIEITLKTLCEFYRNVFESKISGSKSGTCYLSGYVMTNVFQKIGLKSCETTGVLYIKKPDGKQLIYGGDELSNRGTLVGYYHTWCEVEINNNKIIIDPSMKYLNEYLIKNRHIKSQNKLPENIVICNSNTHENIKYVRDDKLIANSKYFLNMISDEIKEYLINSVYDFSIKYIW